MRRSLPNATFPGGVTVAVAYNAVCVPVAPRIVVPLQTAPGWLRQRYSPVIKFVQLGLIVGFQENNCVYVRLFFAEMPTHVSFAWIL
jgi:hypothetical protein